MELVKAVTVEKRWPSMTDDEKTGFWKAFRAVFGAVFDNLRKLSQEPNERFIGRINRGPLFDEAIDTPRDPRPGPFATVKEFHDWLSVITSHRGYRSEENPDYYRQLVPDNAAIVLTHANLHCSNILVDPESPSTIMTIINWDYSGWWPDYWEFCKTEYGYQPASDWNQYLIEYLEEPDEVTLDGFFNYTGAMGN
ncbi:hypothetical protein NW768_004152 [Fusarium equiseti]|uniref:Aminoglycoside phosphotransferase domain-containing protein n=1 Tax=Fusarium equiseti TaxID=61235 RepID=A0ABQ8RJN2_FUSEQ|nr:hypothetical protein NW768_004152 [Fusarium equiseti]